jgi:membrane associated rhomboid family serine protease
MPESSVHPLESTLRLCASLAPEPLYPSTYARETNTSRESLDSYLDQLRMAGLVRLTDWVAGHGQGYALTPAGEEVLKSPRLLARVVAGKWTPPVGRSDNRVPTARVTPWERGEAVREALLYPVQPVVTFVLIAICVVLFLIQKQFSALYGQIEELTIASPIGLLRGQWWRLLTTAFLHANLLHVGCNMYALYALGRNAERIWGHWRFLTIYLVAAWGGSCLALSIQPVRCIGASGAVCGIFAAEAAWVYYNRRFLDPRLFFSWQQNFMINVVLLGIISFMPNVSWAAHLGGAISGLIMALWLNYFQLQAGWRRWLTPIGVILIPLVAFGLLVRAMNSSAVWKQAREYEKELQEEKEREEINNYLPRLASTDQKAQLVFTKDVKPLLEVRASRRNAEDVKKAIHQLDETINDLQKGVETLHTRRPFDSPFIEKVRQHRLLLTETRITLLQLGKECMEKGEDCTEKDEERLKEQEEQLEKIKNEWREILESGKSR